MPAPSPVFGVGAGRAAVLEVLERRDARSIVSWLALAVEPRDERDAARVVLVGRVVEADRLGGRDEIMGRAFGRGMGRSRRSISASPAKAGRRGAG